ncbi:asparagine synthase-related protein [Psychroserpens mesophilus]|uniref:asparagine synthase-related protein n=1 Tax=Psychroserpens mesophilus TaxID=325473 RepID=UPI003D64CE89
MTTLTTSIIPDKQTFVKLNKTHTLNHKAICVFVATGFFLDQDSYWEDEICLQPASKHEIDDNGFFLNSKPWFEWHYSPRDLTFDQVLEEYVTLLTDIIHEQVKDNPVVLPLSGGLDSRSQALVLSKMNNPVSAYSYSFQNGYPEHKISKNIAEICGFNFQEFFISKGYLWDVIEDLGTINKCYSEFTHARQMAVFKQLSNMQGVMSLGHWGDVLFDKGAPDTITENSIVSFLLKKMVKAKGVELAEKLWKTWGLEGDFNEYLVTRVEDAVSKIKIDNISAKVRAFKTSQWAHRWTTTNLSVFEAAKPITLPYYDNRMCKFICTVPEKYLADRQLQIAHIKQHKALARVTWHANKPFNLLNYNYNKSPYNLPSRVANKVSREISSIMGKPLIQRNWELQFLGKENDNQLRTFLFSDSFASFVPEEVTSYFYSQFKNDNPIVYAHPLSMLLTLALFQKQNNL